MKTCAIFSIFSTLLVNSMQESKVDSESKVSVMKPRVVDGAPALITSHPYAVGIGANGDVGCVGTIVDDRAVLTAAHCISPRMNTIYAGSDRIGKGTIYRACRSVLHPNYTIGSFEYDIGLIFIDRPFRFTNTIQKVTVAPHAGWKNNKIKLNIVGFGVITVNGRKKKTQLYATYLNLLDDKICTTLKTKSNLSVAVPKHGICLVGRNFNGNCAGETGSGVIWEKYIVGVVSAGRDLYCGYSLARAMYTDTMYFRSWILSEIKNHNPVTCGSKKSHKLEKWRHKFLWGAK